MDFFPLYQDIVSSRSYYEEADYINKDLDDVPEEFKLPYIIWSSDVEDKLNEVLDVSNIIFGLKQAGTAYVNACFPNKKTIGTLILPEINMSKNCLNLENSSNKLCNIYLVNEKKPTLVVTCNYNISQERAYSWSRHLLSYVKTKNVIIYDTLDATEIKTDISSEGLPHPPYLRRLNTSNFSINDDIKVLETPNFVQGCSASIMSWCEINNVRAVLYLSLNENIYGKSESTVETIEAFEKTLKTLIQEEAISSRNPLSSEQIKVIYKQYFVTKSKTANKSLLYT
jgi:predicted ATP-grasp superfamily ATP-dependent carboligase